MIGLGRMGANMAQRLQQGGHRVVGHDPMEAARARAAETGMAVFDSLAAAVAALPVPRVVWLMVPAGDTVDQTLAQLVPHLAEGDVVIDGGNSNYQDSIRRARSLADDDIFYLDCGTSGGVWGLQEGYSLMIGGDAATAETLAPIFQTLAPAADKGWARVGPSGAGHYTKMIHNGIEYGMMQAYAEGFGLLDASPFDVDPAALGHLWMRGSVVRSWLLELAAAAYEAEGPKLDAIEPWVEDSGEGRWMLEEAVERRVPTPALAAALFARFESRGQGDHAAKFTAALRNQFGGHAVRTK